MMPAITGEDHPCCEVCGSSAETDSNPLVRVCGDVSQGDGDEYVHLSCARAGTQFGTCSCCDANHELNLYPSIALNDAGECTDHAGESSLDYPKADRDSYVENIQKDM